MRWAIGSMLCEEGQLFVMGRMCEVLKELANFEFVLECFVAPLSQVTSCDQPGWLNIHLI
jgi:hypothetical protein